MKALPSWKTIDSAPTDGTYFVGFGIRHGEVESHITCRVGYQEGSLGHAQGKTDTWWEYIERNTCFEWKPTHWIPFPK